MGTTIFTRTYSFDESLKGRVASIWGAPHVQKPPTATTTKEIVKKVEVSENGKTVLRTEKDYVVKPLELEGSKIAVGLDLEHRQKGLLWYSTYKVGLAADYLRKNTTEEEKVDLVVNYAPQASYDEVVVSVDGEVVRSLMRNRLSAVPTWYIKRTTRVDAQVSIPGPDRWVITWGRVAQVANFRLRMVPNFKYGFSRNTLAQPSKRK